jgi:uncharacterized membrane protein
MVVSDRVGESWMMQVLQSHPAGLGSRLSVVTGLIIGLLLVTAAAATAYLALVSPMSQQFTPDPHSGPVRLVTAAMGWTLLIAAPAMAAIAGVVWLAGAVERATSLRSKPGSLAGLSQVLGADYAAATGVRLADGRMVSEIIVGPHGIAVFEPLPPRNVTRVVQGRWELLVGKDVWVPLENPIERALRSADRLRHWIGENDRGFVIRVYAAVISPDGALARTANCAVVTRDQVHAYLDSLPLQRGFSPDRRARIVEDLRTAG